MEYVDEGAESSESRVVTVTGTAVAMDVDPEGPSGSGMRGRSGEESVEGIGG